MYFEMVSNIVSIRPHGHTWWAGLFLMTTLTESLVKYLMHLIHLSAPQSSILSSQSSLYPKSGVLLSLYPKYPKWGTSGVHKRGLTRFLDDLGIVHLRCTSITIPHKPQSSILSSQSSLYHKSVVHLYLYHMYHKCGTSVVHKRGLTRFLDDLGNMHFYLLLSTQLRSIPSHSHY